VRSTPRHSAVFVDPTGRRRRLARRGALLLAVPLAGYVVLLVSTVLGGPTMHTPLLPVPDAKPGQSTLGPAERPAANPSAKTVTPASPTTVPTTAPDSPSSRATASPVSAGTPGAAPASVPTSTVVPTSGNRPTAPPGQARRPTEHSPTAKPTKTPG
jgi:hypothetical protein